MTKTLSFCNHDVSSALLNARQIHCVKPYVYFKNMLQGVYKCGFKIYYHPGFSFNRL